MARSWESDRPAHAPFAIASLVVLTAAVVAGFFAAYQLLETYVLAPALDMSTLHLLHLFRGITGSVLVALFVGWYIVRHASPAALHVSVSGSGLRLSRDRQIEYLGWFVRMRWAAAGFTLAMIVIVIPLTAMLSADYLPRLLLWWAALVIANVVFTIRIRRTRSFAREIVIQTATDLVVLTGLLNASGGLENPLVTAYLFHVIIAAILLPRRTAIALAVVASTSVFLLALGELFHFLPHVTIALFPHGPMPIHEHVHASLDPVFVTGRIVSLVGVLLITSYFTTLVTDRLRESEHEFEEAASRAILERGRLEGVINASGLGIIVVDRDLIVQWFNEQVEGRTIGAAFEHRHDGASSCLACLASETLATGQQREAEATVPGHGGPRDQRYVVSAVRDAQGAIAQAVAVVEDVTERKALEAEALHSGRLSVLGQLAAGIAHEIGNPLSSLNARLELIKRHADPEFARESLDVLQAQIDRIGRIVRGVSHLARNRREGWTRIDLNGVVSECVSLVRLDARAKTIRFEEDLREPLPPVCGVREQLLQVVINLLLNAVEAMPEGGALRASTFEREGRVCVSIADTGAGIDEEVRTHLFEPFVTTKREGTGLGLSICYSLLHAHGGSIVVESEPGRGSCFTIRLPPCTTTGRQEVIA